MNEIVVVDTNVIITAVISGSPYVIEKLIAPGISVVSPKFIIIELFKHSERIQKASHLSQKDILNLLSSLVESIKLYDEATISIGSWTEAYRIAGAVDEKDIPFVALALELDARLWTKDQPLIDELRRFGFLKFYS